jgi:hypothetical protein
MATGGIWEMKVTYGISEGVDAPDLDGGGGRLMRVGWEGCVGVEPVEDAIFDEVIRLCSSHCRILNLL